MFWETHFEKLLEKDIIYVLEYYIRFRVLYTLRSENFIPKVFHEKVFTQIIQKITFKKGKIMKRCGGAG